MNQLHHIELQKEILELRSHILRWIREFFWSEDFLEMETPLLVRLPGQEPYLSPMRLAIHNENGETFPMYLHTSPEYTMKKMLAAGFEKIFFLGKTFRDYESFGGLHNPEFTMIEWYRSGEDFWKIMEDVESMIRYAQERLIASANFQFPSFNFHKTDRSTQKIENSNIENFQRIHMRDLWKEYVNVNLDEYLTREQMFMLCSERGFSPKEDEPYEDLFYRIFLNEIEPRLGEKGAVILHHYPAPMAALSRLSEKELGYAERFELYIDGVEIANCFSELVDPAEQRRRLEEERDLRRKLGKEVYDLDEEFLAALDHVPCSAGIALGVDRLVQALLGCQNIDDVLALPMSQIMKASEH